MLDRLLVDWPLKILALSLAAGIWISVTDEPNIVQDFQPPLTIETGEERILAQDSPATITVRLSGPESSMRRFEALVLALTVDVQTSPLGRTDITLSADNLNGVPGGIEVESISPNRLTLNVERLITKRLPVELVMKGSPPSGFFLYATEIQPKVLTVQGPESEVNALFALPTEAVQLDTITKPTSIVAIALRTWCR